MVRPMLKAQTETDIKSQLYRDPALRPEMWGPDQRVPQALEPASHDLGVPLAQLSMPGAVSRAEVPSPPLL